MSELFWGIRRLFEALAADQPLIVLFDDIHDAAPTFLELLDHLVESSKRVPIVLVCSARQELLEQHPEWEGRPGTATIKLEPLTAADAEVFIDRLLGEIVLPDEVRRRVVVAAEGNPLYVEQMVRMLADDRVASASDTADFSVPPSIQALIAARLDLLSREERAIVEPASVIGLVFPERAVHELVPDPLKPGLGQHLTTLSRKQFVRQADGGSQPTSPTRIASTTSSSATPPTTRCSSGHERSSTSASSRGPKRSTANATASRSSKRSSATTSSRPSATGRSSDRSTPRAGRSAPVRPNAWAPPAAGPSPEETFPLQRTCWRAPLRFARMAIPSESSCRWISERPSWSGARLLTRLRHSMRL